MTNIPVGRSRKYVLSLAVGILGSCLGLILLVRLVAENRLEKEVGELKAKVLAIEVKRTTWDLDGNPRAGRLLLDEVQTQLFLREFIKARKAAVRVLESRPVGIAPDCEITIRLTDGKITSYRLYRGFPPGPMLHDNPVTEHIAFDFGPTVLDWLESANPGLSDTPPKRQWQVANGRDRVDFHLRRSEPVAPVGHLFSARALCSSQL